MRLTRARFLTGAAGLLALTAGAGGAGAALAQTPAPAGRPAGAGPMMGGRGAAGVPAALLDTLGLTAEQLAAERRTGKSLVQIAAERGVGKDALVAALVAEHQTALDARVGAGELTPTQAEALASRMRERAAEAAERTEVGPPAWAGVGPGMGRGPGRGAGRPGPMSGPGAGAGREGGPRWARRG
jgi:hypothetical protein